MSLSDQQQGFFCTFFATMSYLALYKCHPLLEQHHVLFPSNLGTSVLFTQGGGPTWQKKRPWRGGGGAYEYYFRLFGHVSLSLRANRLLAQPKRFFRSAAVSLCLFVAGSSYPPPPPLAHARPCLSTGWALNHLFEEIWGPLSLCSRMEHWVFVECLYRERGAQSCL